MSSAPWFRLYFSDLAGDTLHLSDAEMGSYVLLIGAMWNAGGRLERDEASLARIARCSRGQWPRRWARLARFFVVEPASLCHQRVTAEREEMGRIAAERRLAGKAGASAKALKRNETTPANAGGAGPRLPVGEESKPPAHPESRLQRDADASQDGVGAAGAGEGAMREASRPDPARAAFEAWNRIAGPCGLPRAETLTQARRRAIRRRLAEHGGPAAWTRALEALAASPHCRGRNERGWRADLDFVCQPKSFGRLLEGFYGTGAPVPRDVAAAGGEAPAPAWAGPPEVRQALVAHEGEAWTATWLDQCRWAPGPPPAVVASRKLTFQRLDFYAGHLLKGLGVRLILDQGETP
jgi:uncharacterized protein YdaU (DUF1376 family)